MKALVQEHKSFECTIGIITPYNLQVKEIKKKLILNGFYNIEVATVDSFQGREKYFIIVSTVRSNKKGRKGFVKNENRMNVTITRAKHGLIIIGNADTLEDGSKLWKDYIHYFCKKNLFFKKLDLWKYKCYLIFKNNKLNE